MKLQNIHSIYFKIGYRHLRYVICFLLYFLFLKTEAKIFTERTDSLSLSDNTSKKIKLYVVKGTKHSGLNILKNVDSVIYLNPDSLQRERKRRQIIKEHPKIKTELASGSVGEVKRNEEAVPVLRKEKSDLTPFTSLSGKWTGVLINYETQKLFSKLKSIGNSSFFILSWKLSNSPKLLIDKHQINSHNYCFNKIWSRPPPQNVDY